MKKDVVIAMIKRVLTSCDQWLEKKTLNRKNGILGTAILCALLFLLSLPFVGWINVVNIAELFSKLGITREAAAELYQSYSIFWLLGFVQHSGVGKLGLYAAVLLALLAAAWYFQLSFLWRAARNKTGIRGDLRLYFDGKTAMLLTLTLTAASLGFVAYANSVFGMKGFASSPVIITELVLALAAYLVIKRMEARERKLYREHGLSKELKRNWVLFLMLTPTFLYFLVNCYLPMAGIYFAFVNFNFRDGLWASPFIGFENFRFLFQSQLGRLVRNTVLYNVGFILLGNGLQIFFAILVSQITVKWFRKISQTLMFMPYFVSYVLVKVLTYSMLEYQYGAINNMVTSAGGERIDFYNTPIYWPFLIMLIYLWKNVGYGMVVYLATIMGIDNELFDAANVDGANIFQRIRYITLPHIKPTFIILLIYSLGHIMKGHFELFYQTVGINGRLYEMTDILDTYVYRITTSQPLSIGAGTAAGLFQSLFGFVVVMATNWLIKRKNPEYALF